MIEDVFAEADSIMHELGCSSYREAIDLLKQKLGDTIGQERSTRASILEE